MSQIRAVKEAVDIVEIVGERLQLQRAGSNLKANCPFHSEKTPSFFINPQLQRFRCFGCGEAGDVFEFLQKYEGMSFFESLEYLADRAGVVLERNSVQSPEDLDREAVLSALSLAKEYYHWLLQKHQVGAAARQYLEQRKIGQELIKQFELGAAPEAWDGLVQYLQGKKGFSWHHLEQAGLILKGRGGRYYDRFRGRLMFPLRNHRGQVVGFSGRVLDPDVKEAKYINSPETMVYHKSKMLFGFWEQYRAIRQAEEVVMVEGEFDVLSSIQAKVPQVVAIKGSALTPEHLKLVQRAARRVVLALDRDAAGLEATRRAIGLAQQHDIDLRVVNPEIMTGKDPDELSRSDPKAWRQAVKQSVTAYDFLLQAAAQQHDPNSATGRRAIIRELAPPFNAIPHAVEQDVYIKKLATLLNVKPALVMADIKTELARRQLGQPESDPRVAQPSSSSGGHTRLSRLEEYVLFLLLHSSPSVWSSRVRSLADVSWTQPSHAALIEALKLQPQTTSLEQLRLQLPEDAQAQLFELHTHPEYFPQLEQLDIETEWVVATTQVMQLGLRRQLAAVSSHLKRLDRVQELSSEQQAQQDSLLAQLSQLNQQLKALTPSSKK